MCPRIAAPGVRLLISPPVTLSSKEKPIRSQARCSFNRRGIVLPEMMSFLQRVAADSE